MNKTKLIYSIEEELTPEWVFELQEQFGEDLAKFQVEFGGISEELNKIKIGIKKAKEEIKSSNEIMASARARLRSANQLMASSNELMASSNELMASAKTHLASSNELVESSNARIESASLKKGLALEKMNEIEKKIDATKTIRAEIDNYWNDLINKEIEKRNKCHCTRSQKSCSKLLTKRLNNNNHEQKQKQIKKNEKKLKS
ncbi:unnamed protein product [Rotaria sp. Silwood2]|nr:unnamed protein product [Rotaria sp. Silwood2]